MRSVSAVLLAVASTASAQPGRTDPVPLEHVPELKSGSTAVALSLLATLGSFAVSSQSPELGAVGLMVGPSAGRWYNHEIGGIGIAGRVLGAAMLVKGIGLLDSGGCEAWYTDDACDVVHRDEERGERLVYAGVILWSVATVYDLIEAGRGSARYNKRHAVRVMPAMPSPQAAGVAIGGSF